MIQPRKYARLPKGSVQKPLNEVLSPYVKKKMGNKVVIQKVHSDGISQETYEKIK